MLRIAIVGTGLALSALFAWSIALAQSQSVTPAPAAKTPTQAPTQIAQGTTGITTTITGAAGGIVQNSSVTEGAAATATK